MGKKKVPFKSALDEAEAIDAKVAAMRLNLQMSHGMSTAHKARIVESISDAQKIALKLRIASLSH